MAKKDPQVLRLKITLEHVEPAPWREIEIRSDKTFEVVPVSETGA